MSQSIKMASSSFDTFLPLATGDIGAPMTACFLPDLKGTTWVWLVKWCEHFQYLAMKAK
jgi:hypothetical protein